MKQTVLALPLAVALAALATGTGSVALADGAPVNTVRSAVVKHFSPAKTQVSQIACTRPSSTVAVCSARADAQASKQGPRGTYRVTVTVHIPLDSGRPTSRITRVTRIK